MKTIAPINPFSSRFISPLTSDYLQHESERQRLDQAVRQIQDEKFLQIVGQHGSGKTMAAIEIAKRIGEGCEAIRLITVKPGMSWLHSIIVSDQLDDHTTSQGLETAKRKTEVTILDGLEQLNFVARICLIMSLRRSSDYVIVTTHRPLWFLGTPIHVRPTPERFYQIVSKLAHASSFKLDEELINTVYVRSAGNYRAALDLLYDEFQRRESQQS